MTDDDISVPDAGTFQTLLATLLRTAHENGVDVTGGWEVDGDSIDWDVVVTVVERSDDD